MDIGRNVYPLRNRPPWYFSDLKNQTSAKIDWTQDSKTATQRRHQLRVDIFFLVALLLLVTWLHPFFYMGRIPGHTVSIGEVSWHVKLSSRCEIELYQWFVNLVIIPLNWSCYVFLRYGIIYRSPLFWDKFVTDECLHTRPAARFTGGHWNGTMLSDSMR